VPRAAVLSGLATANAAGSTALTPQGHLKAQRDLWVSKAVNLGTPNCLLKEYLRGFEVCLDLRLTLTISKHFPARSEWPR
jgi:hypothetical protein